MNKSKQLWTTVALLNLCIVALLGVTLRSKILFPLHGIEFNNILHAHSHFAFAGWITLSLITLMVYEIVPEEFNTKRSYNNYLVGFLVTAAGMLVTFLYQGYGMYSNICNVLFILVTYGFSFVFIKDILKTNTDKAVKTLSISALICLVLSSGGPITLAMMMATHSHDNLLYKDSVYTYLHFQYNGFFTLTVFALLLNALYKNFTEHQLIKVRIFANLVSISIIPTLFISYLWHYTNPFVYILAGIGILLIITSIVYFFIALRSIKDHRFTILPFIRHIGVLSIIAFLLKSLLQTGTIIPSLGKLVYGDRAIIIGYLHLVLLGFVTLYIIANFMYSGLIDGTSRFTRYSVRVFAGAIITNEVILMTQGFGNMLMVSYSIYTWLLWGAAIWLFTGAVMVFISRMKTVRKLQH
jgi:hypothetical protein